MTSTYSITNKSPFRITPLMRIYRYSIKLMSEMLAYRMLCIRMIKEYKCQDMKRIIVYRLEFWSIMPVFSIQLSLSSRTFLKIILMKKMMSRIKTILKIKILTFWIRNLQKIHRHSRLNYS